MEKIKQIQKKLGELENNYIIYKKEVEVKVPLLRKLTFEELSILKENMFDLPNDVMDWNNEEILEENHTDVKLYYNDIGMRI